MALSRSSSTTYLRLCILSALGGFAMSATAATVDSSVINHSELPQVELDKIVVTATRTPTKTSNVIAQTRVINQEDLNTKQRYDDIADAMRYGIVSGFSYPTHLVHQDRVEQYGEGYYISPSGEIISHDELQRRTIGLEAESIQILKKYSVAKRRYSTFGSKKINHAIY